MNSGAPAASPGAAIHGRAPGGTPPLIQKEHKPRLPGRRAAAADVCQPGSRHANRPAGSIFVATPIAREPNVNSPGNEQQSDGGQCALRFRLTYILTGASTRPLWLAGCEELAGHLVHPVEDLDLVEYGTASVARLLQAVAGTGQLLSVTPGRRPRVVASAVSAVPPTSSVGSRASRTAVTTAASWSSGVSQASGKPLSIAQGRASVPKDLATTSTG
jgi:hypothetical protein